MYQQTISRFLQLRASLEAAQRSIPQSSDKEDYLRGHAIGLHSGLQIAIDSIDSEIRMIRAGEEAARKHNQQSEV